MQSQVRVAVDIIQELGQAHRWACVAQGSSISEKAHTS